mgnify:FL=1
MKKLIIAIVVILLISGGFYFYKQNQSSETSGWQTYRNEEYGFEFNHPNSWQPCLEDGESERNLSDGEVSVCLFDNEYDFTFNVVVSPKMMADYPDYQSLVEYFALRAKESQERAIAYRQKNIDAGAPPIEFVFDGLLLPDNFRAVESRRSSDFFETERYVFGSEFGNPDVLIRYGFNFGGQIPQSGLLDSVASTFKFTK